MRLPGSLAASRRAATSRLLVTHGADVNIAREDGISPLMNGVNRCSASTLELLLRTGADTEHKDREGATALDYATTAGCRAAELPLA